ncbi:MAG: hypothetical protein ACRDWT_00505 [Jatrophihabitantaceae bacterium]
MLEIAVIAWIAALVLAVVVLAFCAYEIVWKARRLKADLTRLQVVTDRLHGLQADLAAVQRRLPGTDAGR